MRDFEGLREEQIVKAAVCRRYGPIGDVLEIRDREQPDPGEDQVLVRVRAAGVSAEDWHAVMGLPYVLRVTGYGFRRPVPSVAGRDAAGRVEAVGKNVTSLAPGDDVFGSFVGAYAELACADSSKVALKPTNLTYEEAAAVPGSGVTALQALRDHAAVGEGQSVLINGASGGVGTYSVQIAASLGAEVTGVCSTQKVDYVRSIGAKHVIDYKKDEPIRGDDAYDAIVDVAANLRLAAVRAALKPKGRYVSIGGSGGRWLGPLPRFARMGLASLFTSRTLRPFVAKINCDDLQVLKGMIEGGVIKPIIERTYPLDEAADALAFVQAGHGRAKTIISV